MLGQRYHRRGHPAGDRIAYASSCNSSPALFSPTMMVGALMLPEVTVGKIDASTIRRPARPCTQVSPLQRRHHLPDLPSQVARWALGQEALDIEALVTTIPEREQDNLYTPALVAKLGDEDFDARQNAAKGRSPSPHLSCC